MPDDFIGSWKTSTDREDAAEVMVTLIEKATGKTMAQIAATEDWDLTTSHFSDTSNPAVTFLKYAGATQGVGGNVYDTEGTYTRAQIVIMIGRVAERFFDAKMEGSNPFNDMGAHSWAIPFVSYAVDNGITQGAGQGRFNPGGILSNQETIVFLYRAFGAWQ